MDGYFLSFCTIFHITTLIQNVQHGVLFTTFLITHFNPECATGRHFLPFSFITPFNPDVQHGDIFYQFPHHPF
jgi:hypothetical protein